MIRILSRWFSREPKCAFCRGTSAYRLIPFGSGRHAHADCGLKKLGAAFFDQMRDCPLENFPMFAARETGYGEELRRRLPPICPDTKS